CACYAFCTYLIIAGVFSASWSLCIVSFFFSILSPPPRSTLFPYTTLFRSLVRPLRHRRVKMLRQCCSCAHRASRAHPRESQCREDRKSTRLNSSHVSISYAVFCLKKKKIEIETIIKT